MVQTQSILSLLSQPNPALTKSFPSKSNKNTDVRHQQIVHSLEPWTEFNYDNLKHIFSWVDAIPISYDIPKPQKFELLVSDEKTIEHNILSRETIPTVNQALETAMTYLGEHDKKNRLYPHLNFVRGSQTDVPKRSGEKPDWGLICLADPETDAKFPFTCVLPGDTKVSTKWSLEAVQEAWNTGHDDTDNLIEPLRQLIGYATTANRRYGFIITDDELVVLEFALHEPESGIALTRSRRTTTQQRFSVESTAESLDAMSLDAKSVASSYRPGLDYDVRVRCTSIPWSNGNEAEPETQKQKKQKQKQKRYLTVRLALFYLALIAAFHPNGELEAAFTTYKVFGEINAKNYETLLGKKRKEKKKERLGDVEVQGVLLENVIWDDKQNQYYYVGQTGTTCWYNDTPCFVYKDGQRGFMAEAGWQPADDEEIVETLESSRREFTDSSRVGESSRRRR